MMPKTTIMAIEEHTHRYSNSSGGGGGGSSGSGGATSRASKKVKQKKVPQRGLGVAQLERIRLEEEEEHHKKDPIFQTPNVLIAPKSIPFRPSTMDLPSKNCVFRPNPSALVLDGFRPKTLQSSKSLGELSWSSVSGPSGDNCSKLWSCEYSPERESQQGNHNRHGVVFGPDVDLPNELHNPILPLPGVLQRSQQFQQPSCSSSMMNISSGISSSSSSVLNYQMEPPSNQNYYSCNYLPLWPEEVKMAGMKRPYPFSPEFPPVPQFHCKFPPGYVSLPSRSRESASCSNDCAVSLESGNLLKREVLSRSRILSESKYVVRRNKALNGDFLTLAPPTAAFPYQHSSSSALQSQEILTLESVTCQGGAEEPTTSSALSRSVEQPMFGFFPTAKVQIHQEGTNKRNCHVEVGGNVDLNLKL